MNFEQSVDVLDRIRFQLNQVLIGQKDVVDEVLTALLAKGHVLIEGVPGLGKTLLVRALAASFAGDFRRIQFTPDLMPSDVTGHALFNMAKQSFEIRKGPIFTNLLLADEINRAPAKTQAALLEVMQEQQVTIEGEGFKVGSPFMVLATQNPIEQEGTYPLPEAELDRFMLKITIDYPNQADEERMVKLVTGLSDDRSIDQESGKPWGVEHINAVITPEQILELQHVCAGIMVDDAIANYATRLVRATRQWSGIDAGAGPRAAIYMVQAARAVALLNERDFVTPDDIKKSAAAILRHRIQLSAEKELEGASPDQVLKDLFDRVEAPRA
jgi:MoxR-like ATPase